MALSVGAISQVQVGSNSVKLSSAGGAGGVGPYTYQWYMSTTMGFVPGPGNLVAGATSLTPTISGLIPNTVYYFVLRVTDTGNGNATADSAEATLTTAATTLNPNAFAQSGIAGMLDQKYNYNTISAMIDPSVTALLYPGQPVKIVDSGDGVPKVQPCATDSDEVFGFINFDQKTIAFSGGMPVELSQAGNVMYLYATGAIARGAEVTLDMSSGKGAVAQATGASGDRVVGFAYDKAAAYGSLIRVKLSVPSFKLDA